MMKFYGSLNTLKRLLADSGIVGSWQREANGVHMMRCASGANLHWASGNKSIWADGKGAGKQVLEQQVATVLHELGHGDG